MTHSAEITLADLLRDKPVQWGFRGDPYLWAEMTDRFEGVACPVTAEELVTVVSDAFAELTGRPISHPDAIYVERYDSIGMSSGLIAPDFWREKALPLLQARLARRS